MISEKLYLALSQLIWDTRSVICFDVITAYQVQINESQMQIGWELQSIQLYTIFYFFDYYNIISTY